MRRIRLSSHAIDRWDERVGGKWPPKQIANYIANRFFPELRKGIEPYRIEGKVYYVYMVGKVEGKMVFAVLSPDSQGLWSGWTVITFLTDVMLDNIDDYFNWLHEQEKEL